MSDNKTTGAITISDDVIGVIALTAAMESEGVVNHQSSKSFSEFFGKKNLTRCAKIARDEDEVVLDMELVVNFGTKLQTVAEDVQKKVKNAVETMTGLTVPVVNISISGIVKEVAAVASEEE